MTPYTPQTFLPYLRDQLIPDFREADMPSTADDLETAAQLIASLADERAELVAAVLAWWQEHQFDTTDGGTRNLYNDDPAFVTLAQRLKP